MLRVIAFALALSVCPALGQTAATSVGCTPVTPWTVSGTAPDFTLTYTGTHEPAGAGSGVCVLTVTPQGWAGTYTISGPDSAEFYISNNSGVRIIGGPGLPAGTYMFSVTATP